MGHEKDTCIELMQAVVSELDLEDESLEWLTEKANKASRSIANCEVSAYEIQEWIIDDDNGVDEASEEVKRLRDELVEAIELQAELQKVLVKRLEEEIEKRLVAINKR